MKWNATSEGLAFRENPSAWVKKEKYIDSDDFFTQDKEGEDNRAGGTYSEDDPLCRVELFQRKRPIVGEEHDERFEDLATFLARLHPGGHQRQLGAVALSFGATVVRDD